MSDTSYVALFALIVMVTLYALKHRWPLAPVGFCLASTIAAVSEVVLRRWPLGLAALGFALLASWRWYLRRVETITSRS
jgi:hypothetical protein